MSGSLSLSLSLPPSLPPSLSLCPVTMGVAHARITVDVARAREAVEAAGQAASRWPLLRPARARPRSVSPTPVRLFVPR